MSIMAARSTPGVHGLAKMRSRETKEEKTGNKKIPRLEIEPRFSAAETRTVKLVARVS